MPRDNGGSAGNGTVSVTSGTIGQASSSGGTIRHGGPALQYLYLVVSCDFLCSVGYQHTK